MQRHFASPATFAALALVATASACNALKLGFEFTFCGTSEFVVKTTSPGSDYSGEHEVKLSAVKELELVLKTIDDVTISELAVEVATVGAENQAKKASGKIEIGPLDGSKRILVGEYTDIEVAEGKSLTVKVAAEAQEFAKAAFKGTDHGFKAWVTGRLDSVPADLTLRTRVKLSGKIAGGGILKNFACIALTTKGGTNAGSCTPNPCRNDGVCSLVGTVPTCSCAAGFSGATCETTNTNHCLAAPCKNGGVCSSSATGFTCACAAGYSGATCATNINECSPNPCLNGGMCTDGVNAFTCACAPSYSGPTCATADFCAPMPCLNGGMCTNGATTYACACAAGYSGATCATNINECSPNPCQNGGTCTDGVNSFTCACAPGFSGTTCTVVNYCAPMPCLNGSACTSGASTFTCACTGGYSGATCATNIDDCNPNPCQNGGTCTDGINAFTCACAPGYSGTTCTTVAQIANFTTLTGTNFTEYGGVDLLRGLEFTVTSPVSVSSIRVEGLPAGSEGTARLWFKSGEVNLQVTDTFDIGNPITPSSSGSGVATFNLATAKTFSTGTHSLVLMVEDMSMTGDWAVREHQNTGHSLTVGAHTFGSVGGWRGYLDMSGNASSVSLYDIQYFRIPKVAMTLVP